VTAKIYNSLNKKQALCDNLCNWPKAAVISISQTIPGDFYKLSKITVGGILIKNMLYNM